MDDKIVRLFGGPVQDPERKPDETIVAALEAALERARKGEIQDISLVYLIQNPSDDVVRIWTTENLASMCAVHTVLSSTCLEMQIKMLEAGDDG